MIHQRLSDAGLHTGNMEFKRLHGIPYITPSPAISPFLRKKWYFVARGKVGKKIIYRYNSRYKRQDAYDYVLCANPKTETQQANRMKFKDATQAWTELSQEEKDAYKRRSSGRHMQGINLFIKEFMLDG